MPLDRLEVRGYASIRRAIFAFEPMIADFVRFELVLEDRIASVETQ